MSQRAIITVVDGPIGGFPPKRMLGLVMGMQAGEGGSDSVQARNVLVAADSECSWC